MFNRNEKFSISGIHITKDKITFDKKEILLKNVRIKKYNHHFIIYSQEDHYKNKMLYYLKDKDSVILLNLLNQIISHE